MSQQALSPSCLVKQEFHDGFHFVLSIRYSYFKKHKHRCSNWYNCASGPLEESFKLIGYKCHEKSLRPFNHPYDQLFKGCLPTTAVNETHSLDDTTTLL